MPHMILHSFFCFFYYRYAINALMCVCLRMRVSVLWDVIRWGAVLLRARPCVHACSAHTFTIWGPEGFAEPGQAMLMDHLAHIAFSFMAALHSPNTQVRAGKLYSESQRKAPQGTKDLMQRIYKSVFIGIFVHFSIFLNVVSLIL